MSSYPVIATFNGDKIPFEGHFTVAAAGLYTRMDALGRVFKSRTENFDLVIGMPQIDTSFDPIRVMPPVWEYGPPNPQERAYEEAQTVWGHAMEDAEIVYPESARNQAIVYECRFFTSLTASNDEEYNIAAERFLDELDSWWSRFTSWVGIVTSQDFVRLGSPGNGVRLRPVNSWTSGQNGFRSATERRSVWPQDRIAMKHLELEELEACVAATGRQLPPPAEWLFIRDARSLLNASDNRRAVIDAGLAAETAFSTIIDRYFVEKGISDERIERALKSSYSNLNGKKKLVTKLYPDLSIGQVDELLIKPRNMSTHDTDPSTFEQAAKAVELATEIVEIAHPLSELVPIQTR
ncbi:hypothetical protein O6072_02635 [Mycolicibacterium neoaurum]|uniref:hypothetical protein n=1 Tax=Mycolicibacterium neoaurum TaxID=1795 RepID=UPI00248AB986|nr:hypothetical protein [Mycolicibacterium neoaurum]WBP94905.1 hypothetical protein O7W24_01480 [Mycolicibacterium neoaurum]WBS08796.1 hypothetical protein O6072_02635 [Mycolicibacterium neoaurum]